MTSLQKKLLSFTCLAGIISPLAIVPAGAQETGATSEAPGDEIVVTGTRSSIINSLDEKRNEDAISDILSADQAGRFPDNNIAEALARIPGVSFQRNNDTSDGSFISIRGLDASFVTVLNDGLRTGTASSFRRTPLDLVQGDNISSITVTKAPLPEHSSEALGGAVDIRTRGALERSESFNMTLSGRHNTFDEREGFRVRAGFTKHLTDNLGINFSAAYRKRFFNTLQIDPATSTPEILAPLTFTRTDGSEFTLGGTGSANENINDELDLLPEGFIGIENFNVEQVNYDANDTEEDNYSVSGNIDWRASDTTTITLGGRLSYEDSKNTISRLEFDVDNDQFEDFDPTTGEFVSSPGPDTIVIRSFDDPEISFVGFLADEEEIQANAFLRGVTELESWKFNYIVGYSYAKDDRPQLLLNYTQEYDAIPGGGDDNAISFAPFILDGIYTSPVERPGFEDAYRRGLDPFCVDDDTPPESCGEVADFEEELEDSLKNERFSARFDVERSFHNSDFLDSIKVGMQFERSKFTDTLIIASFTDDNLADDGTYKVDDLDTSSDDNNQVAGDYGLLTPGVVRSFGPLAAGLQNVGPGIPLFDGDALRALRATHRESFFAQNGIPSKSLISEAEENFYTAYAQAKFDFGKLKVIGGVRIEQYEADFAAAVDLETSVGFVLAGDGDSFRFRAENQSQVGSDTDNFEVLPRIAFNYDWSDSFRVRAAYSTSISRPTFNLLNGGLEGDFDIDLVDEVDPTTATLADVDSVEVEFDIGNPDLKNAYSHNFDLSLEYYFDRQNAITVALFYKRIDDFIFSSFATPDGANFTQPEDVVELFTNSLLADTAGPALVEQLGGYDALINSDNVTIEVDQAQNGDKAEVYGLEVGVFHTFTYLPSFLSNLGFVGNVTLQETSADLTLGTFDDEDLLVELGQATAGDDFVTQVSFFNSPEIIYNLALFYEDRNWDATIGYRYAGIQLESVEGFGINQYQQGRGFLDLDIDYTIRDLGAIDRVTLFFSANDLLDDGTKFSVFETRGREKVLNDNSTFNGRTFQAGVRFRF